MATLVNQDCGESTATSPSPATTIKEAEHQCDDQAFNNNIDDHNTTFTDPMEASSLDLDDDNLQVMDDEIPNDKNKPEVKEHVQQQTNEFIEKAEGKFEETKHFLLDMIQEVQDMRREQELAKYQSLCSKDSDSRTTSVAEMDIISSVVKKNEQERERLERHYLDRVRELSSERDSLMKESLDSKLKYEAQQNVFDQIKRKNIELECNCSLLKEQNKKLISTLSSTQQTKDQFQSLYEKVQAELEILKSMVHSFEQIASTSSIESEKTKKKLATLDSLLKQTIHDNAKLQKENTQLRRTEKKPIQ